MAVFDFSVAGGLLLVFYMHSESRGNHDADFKPLLSVLC